MENLIKDIIQVFQVKEDTAKEFANILSQIVKISDKAYERGLENNHSAQPTLYGYKIEHLAYIAKVMEKEGVTAEYAVRTFDDMSRTVRMIIEEAQQKVEEMLNEQVNQRIGSH